MRRPGLEWLVFLALGLVGIILAILVSGKLGAKISKWWANMPRLDSPASLFAAFVISLLGHSATVAIFAIFANAIAPQLNWATLSLIVPLGLIASIVPIAIAGIGPREAALVGLMGLVDIPKPDALALSLCFAVLIMTIAGVGGIIQLVEGSRLADSMAIDSDDTTQSYAEDLPQD